MLMSYSEFLNYYHKGDYIYENVLRANLDNPDDAITYFLSNKLIKVDTFYRCPECHHHVPVTTNDDFDDDFRNEFVCYSCGRIWNMNNLIQEKIFRKV